MKKSAKIFSLVLAVIMIISSVPFTAYAAKVKAPAKPTSLSAAVTETTATVKWKKVKGAKGYVLYTYNTKTKKYSKKATTTKTSYKVSKLKNGTTYVYAVKSYKVVKKKKYYSAYSSKLTISTLPAKVTGLKVSSKFNSATLTWTKVNSATSYKVQYSKSKDFKTVDKTLTTKKNSITISPLKEYTTYYYRVYAIKTLYKKNYISKPVSISEQTVDKLQLSTVSESTQYQTVRGFGASSAWWSQEIGKWDNADEIMKYLYSDDTGIGLDIYRYNLGAGSVNDPDVDYWGWRKTESFVDKYDSETQSFTYNWDNDLYARRCLELARNAAGDDLQLTLFNNSAPVEITANGKSYSHYDPSATSFSLWPTNLKITDIPAYVKYETDVADHFVEDGYNVCFVSPINEPQYTWSQDESGYVAHEGCHLTPLQCKMIYKQLVNAMADKPYRISMFEAGAAEAERSGDDESRLSEYLRTIMNDSTNKEYFDELSLHSYWKSRAQKTESRDFLNNKYNAINVSCTEYCQMNNDWHSGVRLILEGLEGLEHSGFSIDFGVQMARIINDDLTVLNAVEWDWWTACSYGYYSDSLIVLDSNEHDNITLTKRYYCLGNYSKFIQPGAVRVKVSDGQSELYSAAFKNTDGSLVIVYVNQTAKDKAVNISANGYSAFKVYTTSDKYNLEQTAGGKYSVLNEISLPANSVVSVVLTN